MEASLRAGGATSGNGGNVEVSGKKLGVSRNGGYDCGQRGRRGICCFDPDIITVDDTGGDDADVT